MYLDKIECERKTNPVDVIERVASLNDWLFDRGGEDEISIRVAGDWTAYQASFSWMEEFEALHLSCSFDLKTPLERHDETVELLFLINRQMLVGHFDVWLDEGSVMFRQALLLNGGADPTERQLEYQLSTGLKACDRYYQAFQLVAWAGYGAREALDNVLFETVGSA